MNCSTLIFMLALAAIGLSLFFADHSDKGVEIAAPLTLASRTPDGLNTEHAWEHRATLSAAPIRRRPDPSGFDTPDTPTTDAVTSSASHQDSAVTEDSTSYDDVHDIEQPRLAVTTGNCQTRTTRRLNQLLNLMRRNSRTMFSDFDQEMKKLTEISDGATLKFNFPRNASAGSITQLGGMVRMNIRVRRAKFSTRLNEEPINITLVKVKLKIDLERDMRTCEILKSSARVESEIKKMETSESSALEDAELFHMLLGYLSSAITATIQRFIRGLPDDWQQ